MVDKVTNVPKSKVGAQIGRLDENVLRLNQAVLVFLGLATSPRSKQAQGDSRKNDKVLNLCGCQCIVARVPWKRSRIF
jgi:hypothetical protein